ncbi:MAG TPA: hypothetical protein RMH99_19410, partial [Sandaracinaceae bacterium LLY-WYZ-13_1]|nr:hypothetical protein [Sandaracinaceae bacterium LLY-WYZ-13_1]
MRGRWICLALLLVGCSCDDEEELAVEGDAPYVRCHAAEAPAERRWSVGALRLARDGERRLTIEGAPEPARLAVFAGPGPGARPSEAAEAVAGLEPHLIAVLGDLGDEPGPLLAALGGLGPPVLVVPGGADRRAPLVEALEGLEGAAADRVVDASVLRAIRLGRLELVPVPGAPGGRYAVDEGACGFSDDDLDAWALDEPADGAHRVLLAWAGPEGEGDGSVTRGLMGTEAGSPRVGRLAEAVGARGALFA